MNNKDNDVEKKTADQFDDINQKQEEEKLSSISFEVPELKEFDTANIFEVENTASKRVRFGKRSDRRAKVKVKNYSEDLNVPSTDDILSGISEEHKEMSKQVEQEQEDRQAREEDEALVSAGLLNAVNSLNENKQPKKEEENPADTIVLKEESAIEVEPVVQEQGNARLSAHDLKNEQDHPIKTGSVVYENIERSYVQPIDLEVDSSLYNDVKIIANGADKRNLETADTPKSDIKIEKHKSSFVNYPRIEEYLDNQSAKGLHFVKTDGKKYYFLKGMAEPYYYQIVYFKDEPTESELLELESEGWLLIDELDSRRKKDAGWYFFRNLKMTEDEKEKVINNDQEKLRYFKKEASSYRSTMFLLFICIVCCAWTGYDQFFLFRGYWWIAVAAGVIALLCLIFFIANARICSRNQKRAKLLKKKLKAIKRMEKEGIVMNENEIEQDWEELENKNS